MMRKILLIILIIFQATAYAKWGTQHSQASIVGEYNTISTNAPFWLMIKFKIEPKWHTYWRNPGETGLSPKFEFNLPSGFVVEEKRWLPPKRIITGNFVNYGYENEAYYLIKIKPNLEHVGSNIPIEVEGRWLVCATECVPESAVLSLNLEKGDENIASDSFDNINATLAKTYLPKINAYAHVKNGDLKILLNNKLKGNIYFFPYKKNIIQPSAPQKLSLIDNKSTLSTRTNIKSLLNPIQGVLLVEDGVAKKYYHINIKPKHITYSSYLPLMLLFALLGGVILNLMPCVFPVLSLKILSLKQSSDKKLQGICYALGILVTFIAIASIMLIIQSFGKSIGWGFQLQSPAFNISLIFLFTLIALNLFGFYEIPFSMSSNHQWQKNHKYLYSFATGILACIVATPCSAPFMATAIGVALSQPASTALLIFSFLGLGLALPYLLVCFIPVLANLLPKPGAWMQTFRELLAFPMLLSVVWLLWVLGQQVTLNSVMIVLIALCALLFVFWANKKIKKILARVIIVIFAFIIISAPFILIKNKVAQLPTDVHTKQFSKQKLQKLIDGKQKVLVYATAAWCITCKINEHLALHSENVARFLTTEKISVLKADWTNKNDKILRYLKSFGRAGVPLYVFYQPNRPPKILPQLLTSDLLIKYLSNHNDNMDKKILPAHNKN